MAASKDSILTAERAREVLRYDPETGKLIWRVSQGRARAGTEAGYVDADRYRKIQIDGRIYFSHRVIWLIITGAWPTHEIDHIDGDGLNNSRRNLREVSRTENSCNTKRHSNNTSGIIGVCWNNACSKWQAQITVNGHYIYLGHFSTLAVAAEARKAAERQYGFHENHGRA